MMTDYHTMSSIANQIIEAIKVKIGESSPSIWYIGIAENIQEKLFIQHAVDEQNGKWLYGIADTNIDALDVKKFFVELGVKNNDTDDDKNGTVVFVYQK